MSSIINLEKTIAASKVQPEIFKIRRKLKASSQPDYIAIMKGTTIEMVCINRSAWDEYQSFKLHQNSHANVSEEISDQEISDGFSATTGIDALSDEPPMTREEYNYYMSL